MLELDQPFKVPPRLPDLREVANAVQVWAVMQRSPYVSVGHVANEFNIKPDVVVSIVEMQPHLTIFSRESADKRAWKIGHID